MYILYISWLNGDNIYLSCQESIDPMEHMFDLIDETKRKWESPVCMKKIDDTDLSGAWPKGK